MVKRTNPKRIGKNQTVPIRIDDPRLSPYNIAKTKASLGAEIEYIGLDAKGMIVGGALLAVPSGIVTTTQIAAETAIPTLIPGSSNNPPIYYPGGSGPSVIFLSDPTNISAAWSGDVLNVSLTWDKTLDANATASQFVIKLTSTGGATAYTPFNTFPIASLTPSGTTYTLSLTKTIITSMFNVWTTSFSQLCVEVADTNNNLNTSGLVCITSIPAHTFQTNPAHLTLTSVSNGYKVLYGESSGTYGAGTADGTFPTSAAIDSVEIWELEGSSSPTPSVTLDGTGTPTGWTRVYFGRLDPVTITTQNFNGRWVIGRFKSLSAENAAFSVPQYILPTSPVTVNTKVPTSATSVTAAWSGNDVIISYTLPGATATITNVVGDGSIVTYTAANNFAAGNVVTITGITTTASAYNVTGVIVSATSTYFTLNGTTTATYTSGGIASSTNNSGVRFQANLVASTGATGTFYLYPDGTGSLTQTGTIKNADLYGQFATYFPLFTSSSSFQSISIVGVKDGGVSFSVPARTNTLSTILPVATATGISNGYVVSWDISQAAGATKAEVYAQSTTFALPSISTFSSTTTTLTFNFASAPSPLIANQAFSVTGLSNAQFNGQFIAATVVGNAVTVTGTGYTTTTSTSGTGGSAEYDPISDTTLVYQGQSPATIVDTTYVPVYIKIRYYDNYDSNAYDYGSKYSFQKTATAINTAVVQTGSSAIPTVQTPTSTISTISLTITTTDTTTTGLVIRYRVHGTNTYTTARITNLATFTGTPSTSTNTYVITGLTPATQYDVNVGSENAYNVVAYAAADTLVTTSTQTVSVPTGLTLTNAVYGLAAAWVAPASPVTPISGYKIELYNNAAPTTVILTDTTYSTTYDFINLTVGTVYFFKVYSLDSYGVPSAAVTSSTVTVTAVSSTQATTLLASQLFSVGGTSGTYNIKIDGTGNGTTTPYKLYSGTGTYNNVGTAFYLDSVGKLSLHDKLTFNTLSTATNGVTGAVVSGINIVYTTNAAHGFSVGSPVTVSGFTTTAFNVFNYPITAVTTSTPFTFTVPVLQSGATGTATGTGTANASLFTVNGAINAYSGNFAGAITVNGLSPSTPMKIGPNADGGTNNGIYINANNYWYDSGNLSIGASGSGVTWNGTTLNVTGNIFAKGGQFTGNLAMVNAANAGAIYSGTLSGSTVTQISATGTTTATFTVSPAITLAAGSKIYVNNLTNALFNVIYTVPTVVTAATTFTATVINGINLPTATLTTQAGSIIDMTSGYILNSSNLAFNNTRLTSDNGGQLITTSAQIGGWSVGTNTIQNSGSAGSYVGLNSISAGPYSIWAGAQSSGGDISNFAVTPSGTVYARNLRLAGGTLDVGGNSYATLVGQNAIGTTISVGSLGTSPNNIQAGWYVVGESIPQGTTVSTATTATGVAITAASYNSTTGVVAFTATNATGAALAGQVVTIAAPSSTGYNTVGVVLASPAPTATGFSVSYASNPGTFVATSATFTFQTVVLSASTTALVSGQVYFVSSTGAHISNTGVLTAQGANISGNLSVTGSSTFGGNISVSTAGSIYSGTLVGSGNTGTVSTGFILNSNGAYFSNAGTSTTTLTASGLVTNSATIGQWTVNSTGIHHVGSNNTSGNIDINSAGNISVSATNVASYSAGINGAYVASGAALIDNVSTGVTSGPENVFWAGSGGATSASNAFRVTLGGNLYASNALIKGTIASQGTLGTITLDGNKDWITLAGSVNTSYILTRNSNIYITAPSTNGTLPWSSSSGTAPLVSGKITAAPTPDPYFAAGKDFNDPWANQTSGIGIYTGLWDYFNNGGSADPFITVSKSGTIQLAASPDIGMIIEKGGATGDAFTVPTIMLYTAKSSSTNKPYSGTGTTTTYGAWATFASGQINLSSSTSTYISLTTSYIDLVGSATAGSVSTGTGGDGSGVRAASYTAGSKIRLNNSNNGVNIFGIPMAGGVYSNGLSVVAANDTATWITTYSLGPLGRQRMLVEDPIDGMTRLGLGIYYQDSTVGGLSGAHTSAPTGSGGTNSGFTGDLWVVF